MRMIITMKMTMTMIFMDRNLNHKGGWSAGDSSACPSALRDPSTCGSVTGHGKAERADRGTLQHAGAEAPGVAGAGLRRGARRQAGQTPLHVAASSGSEAGVRVLVECKADVEARDKVGSGRGGLRFRVREGCTAK